MVVCPAAPINPKSIKHFSFILVNCISNASITDFPSIPKGISSIVVMPPEAAAFVPVTKSSLYAYIRSSMWVCTSIQPGITILPAASIVLSASGRAELLPMAAIFPLFMLSPALTNPVPVNIFPFCMFRSTIFPPLAVPFLFLS